MLAAEAVNRRRDCIQKIGTQIISFGTPAYQALGKENGPNKNNALINLIPVPPEARY